jgi:hypothetical protein
MHAEKPTEPIIDLLADANHRKTVHPRQGRFATNKNLRLFNMLRKLPARRARQVAAASYRSRLAGDSLHVQGPPMSISQVPRLHVVAFMNRICSGVSTEL